MPSLSTIKIGNGCHPRYGYYFFMPYISMLIAFLLFGTALMLLSRYLGVKMLSYLGLAAIIYGALTTIGWAMARYVIPGNRIAIARNIIGELKLSGHERILDVGSGRGLYAIEAAKRLSTGNVVAIDLWNSDDRKEPSFHHKLSQPTGNTIQNAMRNAVLSGVEDKIDFVEMDAARLTFPANHFDLVICAFLISHLWRYQDGVLQQIRRIVKTGGHVVLIDNARDLTYFLLSTPHMFIWSYLRGRKARRLSTTNWHDLFERTGFEICRWQVGKGIIIIKSRKTASAVPESQHQYASSL